MANCYTLGSEVFRLKKEFHKHAESLFSLVAVDLHEFIQQVNCRYLDREDDEAIFNFFDKMEFHPPVEKNRLKELSKKLTDWLGENEYEQCCFYVYDITKEEKGLCFHHDESVDIEYVILVTRILDFLYAPFEEKVFRFGYACTCDAPRVRSFKGGNLVWNSARTLVTSSQLFERDAEATLIQKSGSKPRPLGRL